jgi:hypothetical protein
MIILIIAASLAVAKGIDSRSYAADYDTIVCTEMLEHVEGDLGVIRLWRDTTWCVCKAPVNPVVLLRDQLRQEATSAADFEDRTAASVPNIGDNFAKKVRGCRHTRT